LNVTELQVIYYGQGEIKPAESYMRESIGNLDDVRTIVDKLEEVKGVIREVTDREAFARLSEAAGDV